MTWWYLGSIIQNGFAFFGYFAGRRTEKSACRELFSGCHSRTQNEKILDLHCNHGAIYAQLLCLGYPGKHESLLIYHKHRGYRDWNDSHVAFAFRSREHEFPL